MIWREGGMARTVGKSQVSFDPASMSMCSGLTANVDSLEATDSALKRLQTNQFPFEHAKPMTGKPVKRST